MSATIQERFLQLPEVIHRTGLSRSTIYAYMDIELFPKQVWVTKRRVAWRESQISAFIEERIKLSSDVRSVVAKLKPHIRIAATAWLLEAVRDAQDNNKELPPELLKELSRNLFAYTQASEGSDLHPQAVTDLLMQGLASLRVKTADGTEVEAKRGKAA